MTKKLIFLAFALGMTLIAGWSPRAEALPRYCDYGCTSQTPPDYPCTCRWTLEVTTCGQWRYVCL